MPAPRFEARLTALEAEVARLKQRMNVPVGGTAPDWLDSIYGVFADDPAFEEAMKLGRQYRESLRPAAPKRRKR